MSPVSFGWIVYMIELYGADVGTLHQDNLNYIQFLGDDFSTLWFDDHFHKAGKPTLECWTTLTYFSALFPQYKIGSLVLSQSYRNPALLAKMMATLQYLTGGRYIAGIGAGWLEEEFIAYGYEFPPIKTRVGQLEEAVQIMRRMWTRSPVSFSGRYYSIREATCEPLPDPPPPLLIGGGGERYTLKVVAKHADWMNLTFADVQTYAHKIDVLNRHCDAIGRDPDEITKSLWGYVYVTDDGSPPAPISGDRYVIFGTPEQVGRILQQFMELGVEHFMLRFLDYPNPDGVGLFRRDVLPRL